MSEDSSKDLLTSVLRKLGPEEFITTFREIALERRNHHWKLWDSGKGDPHAYDVAVQWDKMADGLNFVHTNLPEEY